MKTHTDSKQWLLRVDRSFFQTIRCYIRRRPLNDSPCLGYPLGGPPKPTPDARGWPTDAGRCACKRMKPYHGEVTCIVFSRITLMWDRWDGGSLRAMFNCGHPVPGQRSGNLVQRLRASAPRGLHPCGDRPQSPLTGPRPPDLGPIGAPPGPAAGPPSGSPRRGVIGGPGGGPAGVSAQQCGLAGGACA